MLTAKRFRASGRVQSSDGRMVGLRSSSSPRAPESRGMGASRAVGIDRERGHDVQTRPRPVPCGPEEGLTMQEPRA